jgi:NitT/TauT family transport system substrate-binding protein
MKMRISGALIGLVGLSVGLLLSACSGAPAGVVARDPQMELTLAGAPVPPSALIVHMTESEALGAFSESVRYESADDLRKLQQGVEAGRIHGGMASTSALAVMRNQGVPIQLLDVFGWDLLYVLAGEKEIDDWEGLRGSKVAIPYRGSVSDVIFNRLAAEAGLSVGDDLVMRYASNPLQAAEVLAGKQVQAAILAEPWATVAIADGLEEGEPVHRVLNLQEQWGALLETEARIPQVAFFVTDALATEHPEIVAALHEALVEAAAWADTEPDRAAAEAARLTRLSQEVTAESLANSGIEVVPAAQVRTELEQFYQLLADADPALIGGALPDDGFYGE